MDMETQSSPETVQPVAQPSAPGELSPPGKFLSEAFAFYREHLALFLVIGLFPFIANIALLSTAEVGKVLLGKSLTLLFVAAITCVALVVGVIVQLALLHVALKGVFSVREALQAGARLFLPGLMIAVLAGLATVGGFLLLVIPGFMIAFLVVFSSYALVATDRRGLAALSYSWSLVRSMPGALVWRFLFLMIVVIGISFLLGIVSAPLGKGITHDIVEQAFSVFLVTPLTVLYGSRLFNETRARVPELTPEEDTRIRKKIKIFSALGVVGLIVLVLVATLVAGFLAGTMIRAFEKVGPSGAVIFNAPFLTL